MLSRISIMAIMLFAVVNLTGCGILSPRDNLSPQLQQQFDNTNGKISGLQTDQQAVKLELARITQEIGEVRDMQQGIMNLQANNNNRNGVQILQGSGGLTMAFGIVIIAMLLYYFYKSRSHKKTAQILAQQIKMYDNHDLEEKVMAAAMNTDVEKEVYSMVKR